MGWVSSLRRRSLALFLLSYFKGQREDLTAYAWWFRPRVSSAPFGDLLGRSEHRCLARWWPRRFLQSGCLRRGRGAPSSEPRKTPTKATRRASCLPPGERYVVRTRCAESTVTRFYSLFLASEQPNIGGKGRLLTVL